jgi:hypothetical protein
LEISRYEAGQMPLQVIPTHVPALIYKTVEIVKLSAQAKDLTLEVNCDRAFQEVFTDTLRLQQIQKC